MQDFQDTAFKLRGQRRVCSHMRDIPEENCSTKAMGAS